MNFVKANIDKPFILSCYSEDIYHVEHVYTINNPTPLSCANDTVNKLNNKGGEPSEFYYIRHRNIRIGFIGVYKNPNFTYIQTFFIRLPYRNEEVKKDFVDKLRTTFNNPTTTFYKSNIRATKYLLKQGCELINETDKYVIIKI